MSELNEETPEITEISVELKSNPDALYQMLAAAVNASDFNRVQFRSADLEKKFALRVDIGEEQTLIVSSEIRQEWAENKGETND